LYGRVDRYCELPQVPAPCAEMLMCAEGSASTDRASLVQPVFQDGQLAGTLDLLCGSGNQTATIDIDVRSSLDPSDSNRPKARDAYDDCAADLEAFATATPPNPSSISLAGQGLTEVLPAYACVDGPRLLT